MQLNSCRSYLSFPIILFHLIFCSYASADEEEISLFGDLRGYRSYLEDHGLSIQSVMICDLMRNVKGGIKSGGTGIGNHNFTVEVDLDKMKLVEGGRIFVYYLSNFGGSLSKNYVGDYQVVDNIETFSTTKLYEAWYEQTFFDGSLSFLGGIHDYNSEFDVLNYGLHLIQSSYGIGPEIAQIPPSNFPTTTLGFRVRYEPTEKAYGLFGIYDGIPGDPNYLAGTRVNLGSHDGAMTAYEIGYLDQTDEDYKKFALGAWYNTAQYEDYAGNIRNSNKGFYILSEAKIYDEGKDDTQGLGVFASLGFADATANRLQSYRGAGFMYEGLIPERDRDVLTAGVAYARNSSGYVNLTQSERAETALELMYKFYVTDYLTAAPDLQYVINPGMNPSLDNSYIIGLRIELAM